MRNKQLKKTNLLGISGKAGSGKDTVGKILQYLDCTPPSVDNMEHMIHFVVKEQYKDSLNKYSNYEIKKYASHF